MGWECWSHHSLPEMQKILRWQRTAGPTNGTGGCSHRLVASKAEVENSSQAAVLSALERLAEGDYSIEWGAAVFAFWSR